MIKSKLGNEKIYKMRKKGFYIPFNFPNEKCIILPINIDCNFPLFMSYYLMGVKKI